MRTGTGMAGRAAGTAPAAAPANTVLPPASAGPCPVPAIGPIALRRDTGTGPEPETGHIPADATWAVARFPARMDSRMGSEENSGHVSVPGAANCRSCTLATIFAAQRPAPEL